MTITFAGLNKVSKGGQYCIKMAQNDHLVQCLMQCLLINAYYFVVLLSENDNWFLNKRVFMQNSPVWGDKIKIQR